MTEPRRTLPRAGFIVCSRGRAQPWLSYAPPPPAPQRAQMSSFSMESLSCWIWFLSCEPSLVVTELAITGRDTPHERPSACLCGTKMYGTFCTQERAKTAEVSAMSGLGGGCA